MSRIILLVLLGVAILTSCGKKKHEQNSTPTMNEPEPKQPRVAQPRPSQPTTNAPQAAQDLTPLYRFWDTQHNERVYTYGDGEPASWRKNATFKEEGVVGHAALTPFAETTPLFRAYCKDGRHYFYLTRHTFAPDIDRVESFEVFVWTKPGDGRIPVHACIPADQKGIYFDQSLAKVNEFAAGISKGTGPKPQVVEGMFYLYPTASAPSLSKPPTPTVSLATSLKPLPLKETIHVPGISTVDATPDGRVTAVGGIFSGLVILDRSAAQAHAELPTDQRMDKMLALSPNGQFVAASGGAGPIINVLDVKSGTVIGVLKLKSLGTCAAFTPDGKTLYFSGDQEKEIQVWDTATRKIVGSLPQRRVKAMHMTPDGTFLAASGVEDTRVWNLTAGSALVTSLPDPKGSTSAVVLTPDGKTLVLGTGDGFIKIWDVGASMARVVIEGHSGRSNPKVASLAMSPDGKVVASAGAGGAAGVWDVATGKGLAAAQVGDVSVYAVAITDGGKTLFTASGGKFKGPEGSWRGGVKGWDLTAAADGKR